MLYVLGHATLNEPTGPMAGEHESHLSIVLSRRDGAEWQAASLRNTLIAPPPAETVTE